MKLFIGNLSKQVTDAQLNELALPFGTPEGAGVVTSHSGGVSVSRGYGFVVFRSDDEGRAAIAGLNGKDVNGQVLAVSDSKATGKSSRVEQTIA